MWKPSRAAAILLSNQPVRFERSGCVRIRESRSLPNCRHFITSGGKNLTAESSFRARLGGLLRRAALVTIEPIVERLQAHSEDLRRS
jgi:hypothetical protein